MTLKNFVDQSLPVVDAAWLNAVDLIMDESGGSASVPYVPAGTGAVARTVQARLRDVVSILDFGADSTGVDLCNTALDLAKAACATVYFPPGTYRIEGYDLQDLRLIGAGTDGANYGVFTSIIEGSGDIFTNANNFALEHLTIRNSSAGTAGKLITVKDIDTSIGPIRHCNFLKATYHIYHSSATKTIVGASLLGCLFREATVYSRYYANSGLFQYSEIDCYTQSNKRGLYMNATSACLFSAGVFEFQDEGAIYVVNTVESSDVIRGLKFESIHFEGNGAVTPSPDVTINATLSTSRIAFDSCGFYSSTVVANVDLDGCQDARVFEHQCTGLVFDNVGTAIITSISTKVVGQTNGVAVIGGDIRTTGGKFISDEGLSAENQISVTITGSATATPIAAPTSTYAKLVLVRDSTTEGGALLLLTTTAVTVVESTLATVAFTVANGFLKGATTGGASSRVLFFNVVET